MLAVAREITEVAVALGNAGIWGVLGASGASEEAGGEMLIVALGVVEEGVELAGELADRRAATTGLSVDGGAHCGNRAVAGGAPDEGFDGMGLSAGEMVEKELAPSVAHARAAVARLPGEHSVRVLSFYERVLFSLDPPRHLLPLCPLRSHSLPP
jgi:hypothetical protein